MKLIPIRTDRTWIVGDAMNTITAAAYEGDLVSRLRNWRGLHLAHGGRLYDEAADEIERLRQASTLSRNGETMGYMKELDIRIRQGGDDAIAAACELSDLVKERRGYEDIKNAEGDIPDIVTVLRGVGFAAVSPEAGDSASLLHYCVTHAADEIERLRNERRWIPVAEQLPEDGEPVLWHYPADTFCESVVGKRDGDSIDWGSDLNMDIARSVTHWMPLPEPPEVQ